MNRKNLTTAVVAGLAGVAGISATAQAMNLNPDGLGQVLIYPYYTTRNGNTTLLSVVNTTDAAKAVKVRFMEGKNTREVLDFNLYLSPFDVWTAALLDGGVVDADCNIDNGLGLGENGQCGVPHLLTTDTSCTVPYLYEAASTAPGLQSFLPYRLDDGGGLGIDRGAEGHFEMIEMGTLVDDNGQTKGGGEGSASAATHTSSGVPDDCGQLVDAWTTGGTLPGGGPAPDGYWVVDPSTDIEAPSGGLFGGAAVINVAEGYMFSYDAKAINNFQSDAVVDITNTLHAVPGTVEPGLNSGDVLDATIFLDDGTTLASAGLTRGVDAVSFLFMHDQLLNEYSVEADINGATEWVITFPTKHFYVFADDTAGDDPLNPVLPPLAPFTTEWAGAGGNATACESVLISNIYDREEQTTITPGTPGGPPIVSPAPPVPPPPGVELFELCYETNVIEFVAMGDDVGINPPIEEDEGTSIFGALNATTFTLPEGFEAGWASLELNDYIDGAGVLRERVPLGGAADGNLNGLPVVGFAAQKFGNNNASTGIAAFYGGIYNHKGTRSVSDGFTAPTP